MRQSTAPSASLRCALAHANQHNGLTRRHAPDTVDDAYAYEIEAHPRLIDESGDRPVGQVDIVLEHQRFGLTAAHAARETRDCPRVYVRSPEGGDFPFRVEGVKHDPHRAFFCGGRFAHVNTSLRPAIAITSASARRNISVE